jgi:hypothetical protein
LSAEDEREGLGCKSNGGRGWVDCPQKLPIIKILLKGCTAAIVKSSNLSYYL